jgi:hypothetical protein
MSIVWQYVVIPAKMNIVAGVGIPSVVAALTTGLICCIGFSYAGKPEYEKAIKFAEVYGLNAYKKRAEAGLRKLGKAQTPPGAPD